MYYVSVVAKPTQTVTVTDKVKNRLEQLDDFEEVYIYTSRNFAGAWHPWHLF